MKKLLKKLRRRLAKIRPADFIEPTGRVQPPFERCIGILPASLKAIATLKASHECALMQECAKVHARMAGFSHSHLPELEAIFGQGSLLTAEDAAHHSINHGRQEMIDILLLQGIREAFPIETMTAKLYGLGIELREGWQVVIVHNEESLVEIEMEVLTIETVGVFGRGPSGH